MAPGNTYPRSLVAAVIALCVTPALLMGAGVDFGLHVRPLGADSPPLLVLGLLEWSAFCGALFTAVGALAYYLVRHDVVTPIIGVTLLAAGLLDAYHVYATTALVSAGASIDDFVPFAWFLSRLFCAVSLVIGASILVARADSGKGREGGAVVVMAAGLLAVSTGIVMALSANARVLPQALIPHAILSRPYDLIPLLIFLFGGGFVFPRLTRRYPSVFCRALGVSIIPQAAAQVYMAVGSSALHDGAFHVAYGLKVVAYLVPLSGVLLDYVRVYREEEDVLRGLEQTQQALSRSHEMYRTLARHLPDTAVFLYEADLRYLVAEGTVLERIGLRSQELEHQLLFDAHPVETAALLQKPYRQALDGERGSTELTLSGRIIQVSTVPVREGEAVMAGMAVMRDVTEQRVAERALRLTQFSIDRALDAVLWVGGDGRLLYANETACRNLGFSSDELMALSICDIDPEITEESWPTYWERIRASDAQVQSGHLRARDGRLLPVDMNIRYLEYDDREYLCAFVRDISDRIAESRLRMEKEAAEEANHAKSLFLAHMSHELRTPLNSVIGFANVLLKNKKGTLGTKDLAFAERIRDNGQNLLAIINDVLDLSKVEAGKMTAIIEDVNVTELVRAVIEQLSVQVQDKPVELKFELIEGLPSIQTDPDKLRQVLVNLVGNAVKFTAVGSVTVKLGPQPGERGRIRIEVIDTGIGIPADRLSDIFEPFQQADNSTVKQYGGTGLGLAITKRMLEFLGHRLEVRSEVGVGSTFSIVARRTRKSQLTDSSPHTPPLGYKPKGAPALEDPPAGPAAIEPLEHDALVLVIDDDEDARMLLAETLEEYGCRVIMASAGRAGLRMARELTPDLVLLDLVMPGMDGFTVLDEMRANPLLSSIPVAVMSIVATEHRHRLVGTQAIIDKPASRDALFAVVREALAQERQRVLLVDDDEMVRIYLSGLLASEGVQVRTASNGEEAVRVLDHYSADLVVVDLVMPGLDGFGFLGAIRADDRFVDLPVIIVTGRDLTPVEARLLEAEAIAVLPKGRELAPRLVSIVEKMRGSSMTSG